MSQEFEFDLDPKDQAAAIFMGRNHRELVAAAVRAKKKYGVTQQQIADKIGVHKSVISRALSGRNNLTERTMAEICWALGVEPRLYLEDLPNDEKSNVTYLQVGNHQLTQDATTSNSTNDAGFKVHIEPHIVRLEA